MGSSRRDWLISRGLLFLGVFMAVIAAGALGFLIYVSLSTELWAIAARAGGSTLTILFIVTIFGIGCAASGFWGYYLMKRRVVGSTKYELLKIVYRKRVTDEQAAKELKVGTWVVKQALKELRKEGAIG
ncbi:hypothetical protein ES703_04445 [subsurface metagenome]